MAADIATQTITAALWRNEYDSLLRLRAETDGSLRGLYRSHTGASGDYRVRGVIAPAAKAAETFGVALSIHWRAIGSASEDTGRHWVSGLGGQLLPTPQNWRLLLLHNLVVSETDGDEPAAGFHLDKLHYERHDGGAFDVADVMSVHGGKTVSNPLCGDWVAFESGGPELHLDVDAQGEIDGAIHVGGRNSCRIVGFTDDEAESAGLRLQSVAINAVCETRAISLSGWLDRAREELVLQELSSTGTAYEERYLQTLTRGLRFRRR